MGFVKNIKSKLEEHFVADEKDYEDDEIEYEEDGEYEENENIEEEYYEDEEESIFDTPITPPEYVKYGESAPKQQKKSEKTSYYEHKSAKQPKSNIYNMGNTARTQPKFKLNFIVLNDIYDAKNVADIMKEQNAMVVVNLGLLSKEQKVRSMDFLDGVKFVTNSRFTRFTENICAFLPETVELHGDFYDQVEVDGFGSF